MPDVAPFIPGSPRTSRVTADLDTNPMLTSLRGREVVLWGMGHTNAHVLRMWRMEPIPNARLTCVSNASISTYSGMLPGVLAGQYPRKGRNWILCDVRLGRRKVDPGECQRSRRDQPRVAVRGSTAPSVRRALDRDRLDPSMRGVDVGGEDIVTIKPMPTFLDRLAERLRRFGGLRPRGRPSCSSRPHRSRRWAACSCWARRSRCASGSRAS